MIQVGIDVQRKSVHAYPFLNTQPDSADLFSFDPNPRVTLIPIRFDRKISQGSYHDLFEAPNVEVNVAPLAPQVENRVTHELPRAMIGDIASSIDEEKRNAGPDQLLAGDENMI